MNATLLLSIGLPVAYVLVALVVGRAMYPKIEAEFYDEAVFFFTLGAMIFWPLIVPGYGAVKFVTGGVRNKEAKRS